MSKEIKIGLIGAGWMGKAHTTAFHNARMIFGDDMPVFEALKSCSINAKYEHSKVNVDSEQMKSDWMNTKGIFFDEMKNMMILSDEDDTKIGRASCRERV